MSKDMGVATEAAPLLEGQTTLHGSRGSIVAEPGDRFGWWDGTEWEVVGFTGGRIYSPSGLGGTPIVVCKHLSGKLDAVFAKYTDEDGLCEWCGDSVASGLLNDYRSKAPESPAAERDGGEAQRSTPLNHKQDNQ